MKIIVTADLHGILPEIQSCDLLLICGDIVDLKVQSSFIKGRRWYRDKFKPWAESLPCDKVLFIAGNHDLCIEGHEDWYETVFPRDSKVTFLDHTSYNYKGLIIFGTPYCKEFGNWAYNATEGELEKLYEDIPEYVDILMTHDAPYGTTDVCLEGWNREHLGNIALRDAILKKDPTYAVHGHLHSSNHEYEYLGKTKVYNTSFINEQYEPFYEPLCLEIGL